MQQENKPSPILAFVVPCYNEEEVLPSSIKILLERLRFLKTNGVIDTESYVLFVDDGSDDSTWSLIANQKDDVSIRGLRLCVNVGHQNALLAGLHEVNGRCDAVVSIDADLQDDLDAIEQMIDSYQKGAQIVLGVRQSRDSDAAFKRITAHLYYHLLNIMKVHAVFNHADYRLLSARALNNLCLFPERNLFLRAFPKLLHREIAIIKYNRQPRFAGDSKYTLTKMLSLAWEGVTSFSIFPLRFVTVLGGFISLCSIFSVFFVLWAYFAGNVIPGWASITLPIYLLGGLVMFSIGILGEYIGKIFIEVKLRPRFLIDERLNTDYQYND